MIKKSDFDGHPVKPFSDMSPKEKLQYLSDQIVLHRYIKKNIKRTKK